MASLEQLFVIMIRRLEGRRRWGVAASGAIWLSAWRDFSRFARFKALLPCNNYYCIAAILSPYCESYRRGASHRQGVNVPILLANLVTR